MKNDTSLCQKTTGIPENMAEQKGIVKCLTEPKALICIGLAYYKDIHAFEQVQDLREKSPISQLHVSILNSVVISELCKS